MTPLLRPLKSSVLLGSIFLFGGHKQQDLSWGGHPEGPLPSLGLLGSTLSSTLPGCLLM